MRSTAASPSLLLWTSSLALAADPYVNFDADFQRRPKTAGPELGGLVQLWAYNGATAANAAGYSFRIRRAELRVRGTAGESFRYFLMADAAKVQTPGAILQDALIAYAPAPGFELVAGQFKTPTTSESLMGSSELIFSERSLVGRTWGDKREPGAELVWKGSGITATGMVSTDAHLRVEYAVAEDVRVGAFTTAGDFSYSSKGRWGGNAGAAALGGFARFEAVQAYDRGAASRGWVAEAGYRLTDMILPVARYELLESGGTPTSAASVGVNCFLSPAALLRGSLSVLDNQATDAGANKVAIGSAGTLFMLNAQVKF